MAKKRKRKRKTETFMQLTHKLGCNQWKEIHVTKMFNKKHKVPQKKEK
jgi:hypothetical protein